MMDPELLKQRAAFQKQAARNVSVQQRPTAPPPVPTSHSTYNAEEIRKKKKKKVEPEQLAVKAFDFDYKTVTSSSNATNFQTMAKVVDYMKKRHLSAQQWALSIQEILDECQVYDLPKKTFAWLEEALPRNPRLRQEEEGKFVFNPPLKVKGKNSLLNVIRKYHVDGKGGILLSELNECIPNGEKVVESLGNAVIIVNTQVNKRKDRVFFFNDPETDFDIDEDLKALWRMVSVDHLDERKIEEYLQKHGIDAMKDLAPRKLTVGPPKRKAPKRKLNQKVHNEHLNDVLQDYESDPSR